LRDELNAQLQLLKRDGLTPTWHDHKIQSVDEWGYEIDENMNSVDVIELIRRIFSEGVLECHG
jgi:hypothetical protein